MLGETLNLMISTQSQRPQSHSLGVDLGTNLAFGLSPWCPFGGKCAHFGDGLAANMILGVKIGDFRGLQAARVATVSRFGEILPFFFGLLQISIPALRNLLRVLDIRKNLQGRKNK